VGEHFKKVRFKKCKVCLNKFEVNPFKPLVPVCGITCAITLSNKLKQQEIAKKWRQEKKVMKEKLKTHKDYLRDLQKVFNSYIRLRDKDLECVSCGCSMQGRKGDASHFYSVGGNANLRFNEDNVHLACVPCNQHKHGNIAEYAIRLPLRIGVERFEALKEKRNKVVKLSIDEINEKIKYYKKLLK
jgi:hypothetical protein